MQHGINGAAEKAGFDRGEAPDANRFDELFAQDRYVALKNYLYNYLLRKRAIEATLAREKPSLILEVGSGISPVMTCTDQIVYSELSVQACGTLRRLHGKGSYVAADATRLPFRDGAFSHTISSEVIEHIAEDQQSLRELARVMPPGGRLIVTFPHRKFYYTFEDRFIGHYRRYELDEMVGNLSDVSLRPLLVQKVLGPLEKLGMMAAIYSFNLLRRLRPARSEKTAPPATPGLFDAIFKWGNRLVACVAWLDARIVPRALSTVLLILAEKTSKGLGKK